MKKTWDVLVKLTSKICFAALCVMVAYATLFGTGDFSKWIGGFNLWGTALAIAVLCGIPGMLNNWKRIMKDPFLWMLIAFGAWNVVCLVVGIRSGNQMNKIISDVGTLIYFVLFPVCLSAINSKERVMKLMHIAVVAAMVLGLFTCVLLWSHAIDRTYFPQMYNFFIDSYFVNFTFVAPKLPRILFVSAPFQLYGCAFSVYFLAHKPKHTALYIAACALSLFSFVMTYTRALYLATAVAAILAIGLMLYVRTADWKRLVRGIVLGALGCVLLLAMFSFAAEMDYFGFALQRVFVTGEATEPVATEVPVTEEPTELVTEAPTAPATEVPTEPATEVPTELVTEPPTEPGDAYLSDTVESDGIRQRIKRQMLEILEDSPVTGHGLGTVLPDRVSAPEYSYLDIAIKSGWVGLALYLLPIFVLVLLVVMDLLKKRDVALACIWIAALSGQLTYAIFQPYVYSGMAILLYCCTLAVYSYNRQENKGLAKEN